MSLARLGDAVPHARLLSNRRYSVLVTGAGTGYSSCDGYALTSWSADRTEDGDGFFIYLRDLDRGRFWSAGHQPVRQPAEVYDARYEPGRVRIERLDDGIEASLEVCVAPGDDVEIRRLCLCNRSDQVRRIELTSYAEVVLNHAAAHAAHPAFSKLFVQTEYAPGQGALLARRRPRSRDEQTPWMMHALAGDGALQYETDRARFIGRGRTLAEPIALASPLSGTAGDVLDPIFSLRRVAQLGAGESARFTLLLGAARTREAALDLAARYSDPARVDRIIAGAGEHEAAQNRCLGISDERAEYLQELAGAMVFGHPVLRADAEIVRRSHGQLSGLRQYGVAGEGLLAVVHVNAVAAMPLARTLLEAQAYWQAKGLPVELLILCAEPASLVDDVRRALGDQTAGNAAVRRGAEIPQADLDFIQASAHLVVSGSLPPLPPEDVSDRPTGGVGVCEGGGRPHAGPRRLSGDAALTEKPLLSWNGYGGFNADGSEYVIRLAPDHLPPMPWVNVIANETFGFMVSESASPRGTTIPFAIHMVRRSTSATRMRECSGRHSPGPPLMPRRTRCGTVSDTRTGGTAGRISNWKPRLSCRATSR
jgi:cyclic beta-1,2-glucan synthetase